MTEAKIGKLLVSKQQQDKATLHCYSPGSSMLTIDLLDSLGRPFKHEKFHLSEGENEICLSLSRLPSGDYNAWISIGDKTAIRSLHIQNRKTAGNFLMRWIGQLL
ncbi:MAG: hypothetical protein KDD02_09200 [Phaeodactylibacter sp.]|nr:hypothetical protein [Phaeodactylibacter sp.]MCB9301714.1 hypothetical protein [Lewinellaceae bacterium]